MLWACIALPQLSLDAVVRQRSDTDQALVIVGGAAQRRVLRAVSARAAAHGLYPGQSLAAAQALLAEFVCVEEDPRRDAAVLKLLAAWAYQYSAQVSHVFADAIVLEVQASMGLFGPWPKFARRLQSGLDKLGFAHQIAIAPTANAARLFAGIAHGLSVTDPKTMLSHLRRADVAALQLPGKMLQALQAMGLRRVSAVLDAPRAALIRRFGPELLHYLDQLSGRIPENLTLYLPPEHFDQKVELSFGAESTESLLFPLKRLTSDLAAFVSGRDAGVQCFALHLEHEGHPPTRFAVGLLSAERDPVLLFEHARARLERVAVAAPVIAIRLLASDLPAFVPAGRHLFEKRTQQMMAWPQLRERLRSRLGDEAVHALDMHPDHRPEYATRRIEKTKQYVVAEHSAQRPTWLLSRPVPLRDSSIEVLSGPERLETGWWDGDDVRRDYYIVQTSSGQQAWVFCPVGEQGPYMLHGWFA